MNDKPLFTFSAIDSEKFKEWISLNWDSITWGGLYTDKFLGFWKLFFQGESSLEEIHRRFAFSKKQLSEGPLLSWVEWLEKMFLCYIFIEMKLKIKEICQKYEYDFSHLSLILRDYFVEKFPDHEGYFNNLFQANNMMIIDENLNFDEINKEKKLKIDYGPGDDDVMPSLEVTLYPEWSELVEKLESVYFKDKGDISKINKKSSIKKQIIFFNEVIGLFFIGFVSVYGLKSANLFYEKYLSEKVKLFRPDFLWPDKKATFQGTNAERSKIGFFTEDIKKIKRKEEMARRIIEHRFETESEMSGQELGQGLFAANFEKSLYEEEKKGGYRDERYGKRKVYRVLIRSISSDKTRRLINDLMPKFKIQQAHDVRPGTYVPGGVYYNLLVPLNNLNDFLGRLKMIEESKLYESKTRRIPPIGMAKVFIWIKNI